MILAATRRRPAPSGPQVAPVGILLAPTRLRSPLRGSFRPSGPPFGPQVTPTWILLNPVGPESPSGPHVGPAGHLSALRAARHPYGAPLRPCGPQVAPAGLLSVLRSPLCGSLSTLWAPYYTGPFGASGHPYGVPSLPFGPRVTPVGSLLGLMDLRLPLWVSLFALRPCLHGFFSSKFGWSSNNLCEFAGNEPQQGMGIFLE